MHVHTIKMTVVEILNSPVTCIMCQASTGYTAMFLECRPCDSWEGEGGGTRYSPGGGRKGPSFAAIFLDKVKRGYSDTILTPGVIPILECRSSVIKVKKLKTALHIAGSLTFTCTETKKSLANSTVSWRYKRECRNYPAVGNSPALPYFDASIYFFWHNFTFQVSVNYIHAHMKFSPYLYLATLLKFESSSDLKPTAFQWRPYIYAHEPRYQLLQIPSLMATSSLCRGR